MAVAENFTAEEVTSFLRSMSTQQGGRNRDVYFQSPDFWSAEPNNRQRLDHYIGQNYQPDGDDDSEGWDSDGWEDEYAGPLRKEVQKKLDARFGKDVLVVDIGEKGHIDVQLGTKGRSLMQRLAGVKDTLAQMRRLAAEGYTVRMEVTPEDLAFAEEHNLTLVDRPHAGLSVPCNDLFKHNWVNALYGKKRGDLKKITKVKIRLDLLTPLQESVPLIGLHRYFEAGRGGDTELPQIDLYKGRWMINSGHTRLAAARLRGESQALVTLSVRDLQFDEWRKPTPDEIKSAVSG